MTISPLSLEAKLNAWAVEVRDSLVAQYGTLSNTCDVACENFAQILEKHDIEYVIIHGEFVQDEETEGHIWIMVENFIVDPSVEQFGDYPMVVLLENTIHYAD